MKRDAYLQIFHYHDGLKELPPTPSRDITPIECFAAGLLAVAGTNEELEEQQIFFLFRTISIEDMDNGFLFYEQFSMEHLLEEMDMVLNTHQRFCLIANALDFAMSDGFYRSNERRFIKLMREYLKVEQDRYNHIYQTIMCKFDMNVFYS